MKPSSSVMTRFLPREGTVAVVRVVTVKVQVAATGVIRCPALEINTMHSSLGSSIHTGATLEILMLPCVDYAIFGMDSIPGYALVVSGKTDASMIVHR